MGFENGLMKVTEKRKTGKPVKFDGIIKPFSKKDDNYRYREILDDDNEDPSWAKEQTLEADFMGRGEIKDAGLIKERLEKEKEERARKGQKIYNPLEDMDPIEELMQSSGYTKQQPKKEEVKQPTEAEKQFE